MPSSYLQGIQLSFDNQAQIVNDIYVVSSNWFVNRCPVVARTPRVPVGSPTFTMIGRGFRPRVATLAAPVVTTDGQITLADASPFMNGDVLELASGERVEITAAPILGSNAVTVRRGVEGSTAGTGSANDVIRLIGNTITGADNCRKWRPFLWLRFSANSAKFVKWADFPFYLCHLLSTWDKHVRAEIR